MGNKLFIIDAMALAYRSYHAFGANQLKTSAGLPTSAIMGTAAFIERLIDNEQPDYLVITSDSKSKTFRHNLYNDYKAHRKPMPEDLAEQIPHIYRYFEALGVPFIKQDGLEADDLIGSLCHASKDLETFIVSGDKDFLQLVDDSTFLYSTGKGGVVKISGPKEVQEKFGIAPNQVIDILAIMGDSADNVPGIPGVGEKGASKLIQKFGSVENIYMNLEKLPNTKQKEKIVANKDLALLSKQLVTIKVDAPLPKLWRESAKEPYRNLLNQDIGKLYEEWELNNLLTKWTKRQTQGIDAVAVKEINGKEIYNIVTNRQELSSLTEKLSKASEFSFDTETTGLDLISDHPIGLSFSIEAGEAWYIPMLRHQLEDICENEVLETLKPILRDPNKSIIGHNIKFDYQMMLSLGIELKGKMQDTMVAAHMVNSELGSYSLDSACLEWLNYKKIPTQNLIGKNAYTSMTEVPLKELVTYACEDADLCLQLFHKLKPQLEEFLLLDAFEKVEAPLIPVLGKMERQGIHIDTKTLAGISSRLEHRLNDLTSDIYTLAGEEFNINSPQQLGKILYDKLEIHKELGIKTIKKTKSGYSTDVTMLEKLGEAPIAQALLEFRSLTKLKSTYTDKLPELVNKKSQRLHTNFHQTGTQTGRLSSSSPNLQNIPIKTGLGQEIRTAFSAASPDHALIAADYSQVELRILAHLANEQSLQAAFEANQDIHSATAANIFSVNPKEVTREQRAKAKAINFGLLYGMGPSRLARETGVSLKEAKSFIEKYFESYPGIKTFIDKTIHNAKQNEFVTTISGRRRLLSDINSGNRLVANNAENMAINTPIQGSAADLIKLAMVKIEKKLEESGLRAKMILQVHDELVFECPKTEVEEVQRMIEEAMEQAFLLKVPLKVDVGEGQNWLEAH